MAELRVARSELILGGQKSGKTARAETLAAAWLAQSPAHKATYVATAQAWDEEMRDRIARHRQDRAQRVPGMATIEEPLQLAEVLRQNSRANTLLVVDCLTLWLTNLLLPAEASNLAVSEQKQEQPRVHRSFLAIDSIADCTGPVVLVSNEIGLGVIPLGREVRAFVDALGLVNQRAATACERVTLMAAGLPLTLKDSP